MKIPLADFKRLLFPERAASHYEQFWGKTIQQNGLTTTIDGVEKIVLPKDIKVNDLGKVCGQCRCGHAIRYEYWLADFGPVGSSCIQMLTGLNGGDLRILLKGSQLAKVECEQLQEFVDMYDGHLSKQLESDNMLAEKLRKAEVILPNRITVPKDVALFIDYDVPMPFFIQRKLDSFINKAFPQIEHVKKRYGDLIGTAFACHKELCTSFEDNIEQLGKNIFGDSFVTGENTVWGVVASIGKKIDKLGAYPKAVDLFIKCVNRMQDERMLDALDVLMRLKKQAEKLPESIRQIVEDMYVNAIKWGLSEKQINFVLEKSSSGRPGLAVQFKPLLIDNMVLEEKIEPKQGPQELIVKAVEDTDRKIDFEVNLPGEENVS
jgi:hypothetical protein